MSSRRLPSWAWVTGLLSAALVVVVGLAVRAEPLPEGKPAATGTTVKPSPGEKKEPPAAAHPVPEESGQGRRVVYSLELRRVWLVDGAEKAVRTFEVWPGSVHPAEGSYKVFSRMATGTGTDGVSVANVIYFARASGATIAFSNAVDGARPKVDLGVQTGAVRQGVADGTALWAFAPEGTPVHVVT
ncbi:hypothetical protein ACWD6I_15490 [Streptomyces sp. NPDC002454]|uniref:hypothetical protein n=1 Tax=unclassified Streptomyces TaxID=2593676 RepID=UPI0033245DC0